MPASMANFHVENPVDEIIQTSSGVGFAAAKALASASNTFQVILASRPSRRATP